MVDPHGQGLGGAWWAPETEATPDSFSTLRYIYTNRELVITWSPGLRGADLSLWLHLCLKYNGIDREWQAGNSEIQRQADQHSRPQLPDS